MISSFPHGRRIVLALVSGASLLAALAAQAQVAAGPPRIVKITLVENYGESLHTIPRDPVEPGDPPNHLEHEVVDAKKLTANVTAELDGLDLGGFDAGTPVYISIGNYSFGANLGDDPNYAAGKSKEAVFPLLDPEDENGRRKVGQVAFSWTKKTFTVSLTSKSIDDNVAIEEFLGTGGTSGKTADFSGVAPVFLGFADQQSAVATVVFKGKTRIDDRSFGHGREGEKFTLQRGNLAGALDGKAPVLKSVVPARVEERVVDLQLVYEDNDPSGVLGNFDLTVNGRTGAEAYTGIDVGVEEDSSFPGRTTVRITGLVLDAGKNAIVLTATDNSGNISRIKKRITAPGL